MTPPFPAIEPYDRGLLDVGDGNRVYWETCGNPDGKPALVVHGGPGSGCGDGSRRSFDPRRYRIILFDQRGCGRSTPHASDPATEMRHNTTAHLLRDMEALREHLGVRRWLLFGGSWGSTLILAYAQRHPDRVSEIVIPAVTTTRRVETDWLYRGVGRFFPRQWQDFARFEHLTPGERLPADGYGDGRAAGTAGLLAGYARLLGERDQAVRGQATEAWCRWEDTVLSGEPGGPADPYGGRPPAARTALVRICAHYFGNGAWLDEGVLLREAHRLAGIPGVLIHGRLDLSSPLDTAWRLSRVWRDAELHVVDDAGHKSSNEMRRLVYTAIDRFAGD